MTQAKIAIALVLVGITSAHAAGTKTFHSIEGNEKACKLAKFLGGKWLQSNEKDLDGQEVASVTQSKSNSDFSNFKFQNAWYAAKNDCLKDSGSADLQTGDHSVSDAAPRYAIELKIQKTLLMGSGDSASTSNAKILPLFSFSMFPICRQVRTQLTRAR
jgi:hypothetical protein